MAWEARCNQQGYTYYVDTETGVMQWAPPPAPPLATETIEIVEDDAPCASDSSRSEADNTNDDDEDDEDDDQCETLLNSRDLDQTLGLPRLVQTTVYRALTWVVLEVWQSHRELGAYLAHATQRLLHGLPPVAAFLRPSRATLVHPHAIPTSFIPSSPKSAVVADVSDDVALGDDMA
ncbi:hypothetical protein SDRG_14746 [Saprolegnia diclina VS20]|uniref:WW domain-containing protein n=1 Tax=Saprolegnia diclina (strain VS20) TaxID=1156394 RepID=T0Q222_SAPDV|nr:hypothetical protein SDRG_14746 [Saprolegnia diclina VS20]EQC27420.1 hypothetical protein SDRG_14746 [Saprolegnia diclina VS20]|eukprot:XP_008619120.1 hypothetical protein SDRG_14746 [Saprolegnia diclina VS20]